MKGDKLGIALVGLGNYSKTQLATALKETKHCYLAGIVTGRPSKAEEWKKEYGIEEDCIYDYSNFDSIRENKKIDIVYVVLPNSMHAEFVVRAAKAGKHVICEKPMATSVADSDRMIAACKEAGVQLSIGYRLHFELHNLEMMRIGQGQKLGAIKKVFAEHGLGDTSGWRLDAKLAGGGPLPDVGVYCLQACRYVTGMEPVWVEAQQGETTDPQKFKGIEQSLTWQMGFPNGIIAECRSSYSEVLNKLRVEMENGWAELSPAFKYKGIIGKTSEGELKREEVNQQAKQMDDFALCVKENRPTKLPGEMGRQDVMILEKIYEAMGTGKRVMI